MTKSEIKAWIDGCLAGVYRPLPKETIWQWAERTLIIPKGAENPKKAGQRWSSDYSPYVREIMDWFRSTGKSELFVCKSSQVGLTMTCLIVICWHIVHRPTNIGYCIDSREEARKISKSRLQPWITQNNLLERIGEEEDSLSNMTFFLRGMLVHMLGAYSVGTWRNKMLGIGILDELDAHPPVKHQGNSADAMRSRLKQEPNSKLLGFSKPKLESDQTWQECLTGTMEKYFVPCPHCDHMQPLEWKNVIYKGKEFEDLAQEPQLDAIKAGAYYACEMCKKGIDHSHKYDMLLKGQWRATNPKAIPGKRSMLISDLYSNAVTWGELAVEWIEAQKSTDKLTAFVQDRLGEPMKRSNGQLRDKEVLSLREKSHRRGICPVPPVLVAIIVDVQAATMKWGLLAYTSAGDMIVIDYGEALTWDEIDFLIETPISVTGSEDVTVQCGLVDEGDGNRTHEVRSYCARHDNIFPVKGRGRHQARGLITTSVCEHLGIECLTYHVSDDAYANELVFNRIKRDGKNRDYAKQRIILPWDISEDFVDEITSVHREVKPNKYGFEEQKWHVKGKNDYFDVLKYGLALWDINAPVLKENGLLDGPPKEIPAAPALAL
jgi:hypothetical protein